METFAAALRGWRERLAPEEAGITVTPGRRLPGLRRAELARLAGVSVDYLTRLEQGRARHPSPQAVHALARALRLTGEERRHLFHCADLVPPDDQRIVRTVPGSVRRLVDAMAHLPAGVFTADWQLIGWNTRWAETMGHPDTYGWKNNSLVEDLFGGSPSRAGDQVRQWGSFAELVVADLRTVALKYPADEQLAGLIARLEAANDRFAQLWRTGPAGPHRSGEVAPSAGGALLECHLLAAPEGDVRVVVFTPATSIAPGG